MPNNPTNTTSEPQSFSIVPTHSGIMPTLLAILENPKTPQASKQLIRDQVMRLAKFADDAMAAQERAAAFDLDCG